MPKHWLMKSEPDVYSIDDLARDGTTFWNGVRNYAARNHMQAMKKGDLAFFYHSNADPSGVAGVMEIVGPARADESQFDKKDADAYDAKATKEKPIWFAVDVGFVEKLPRVVSLAEIKAQKSLAHMALLKQGRLSVGPVTPAEWRKILAMARA